MLEWVSCVRRPRSKYALGARTHEIRAHAVAIRSYSRVLHLCSSLQLLWVPCQIMRYKVLPPETRVPDETDTDFAERVQKRVAGALGIRTSEFNWRHKELFMEGLNLKQPYTPEIWIKAKKTPAQLRDEVSERIRATRPASSRLRVFLEKELRKPMNAPPPAILDPHADLGEVESEQTVLHARTHFAVPGLRHTDSMPDWSEEDEAARAEVMVADAAGSSRESARPQSPGSGLFNFERARSS